MGDAHQRGGYPVELPERGPDLIDDLRPVGAQPTPALAGVAPPLGDLAGGVGQHGNVEDDGGQPRFADGT